MRYLASIAYDGTDFCGWQRQPISTPSIQATVESALTLLNGGQTVSATASGRTDAGVHALDQRVHFDLNRHWDQRLLLKALNANLPEAIRLQSVCPVADDFHALRDAIQKQYAYYLQAGVTRLPHLDRYAHWIPVLPDLERMQVAASRCTGRRDFATFQGAKAATKTTIRDLIEFEVKEVPHPFLGSAQSILCFRLLGTGFLKQMVRSLVGTVLEVGLDRRDVVSLDGLFAAPDRLEVGETLPAKGLFLERVWYKTDLLCNTP